MDLTSGREEKFDHISTTRELQTVLVLIFILRYLAYFLLFPAIHKEYVENDISF